MKKLLLMCLSCLLIFTGCEKYVVTSDVDESNITLSKEEKYLSIAVYQLRFYTNLNSRYS